MSGRSKDQDLIDELAAWMQAPAAERAQTNGHAKSRPDTVSGLDLADEQVIEKCRAAKDAARFSGLFDYGDMSANNNNASDTDYALLGKLKFWTQDPDQLDRIMRLSALRRPKWDEGRGGRTWLRYSIDNALEDLGEVYDWGRSRPLGSLSSSPESPRELTDDDNNEDDLEGIVWFSKEGEPKEREYLIENVAVKNYTIVAYGAGGVAKSFAVLAAGIAIAGGSEEWLGLRVLDHGYVLYLDFELDAEEQHRRVRDLCAGLGVDIPEKLAYFSALGMPTEKAFAKAKAFVKEYGNEAKAIIIDSMGLAMQGDMDHARDVIAFHRRFTDPLRVMGITPFVVDHEGKLQSGENRKEKGPTGSAFKSWTTRSVLQFILEEYDEANSALDIRVRQHKTNFKPTKPFGVRFTFEEKKVSVEAIDLPDTELIDETYIPVKERITAALAPGEATIRELAQLTGAEVGTVRNKVSELMGEERITDAGYRGREKLYEVCGGGKDDKKDEDLVTREDAGKTKKRDYPSDSLLSSSPNALRDLGGDDNNSGAQTTHNENKEAQAKEAELQGSLATVAEFFANPPDWLTAELPLYRENPGGYFKPLCAHVAAVLLGDHNDARVPRLREEVKRELTALGEPLPEEE